MCSLELHNTNNSMHACMQVAVQLAMMVWKLADIVSRFYLSAVKTEIDCQ